MMADGWWIWIVAGLGLAIVEMVLPGWIFLGFAIGAVLTGILLLVVPMGSATVWLVFGIVSLLVWAGLRRALGVRKGQVKIWTRDINDN